MATQEKLTFIIEAEDRAKAVLQSLEGNFKGLQDSIKSNEESIKTISATAGIAFAGIGLFAKASVAEAQESIKVNKQLEAVIKSTGGVAGVTADQARGLAQSLSQVTNFQDDAIISAQNMLLTFTNIKSDVFPQVTEMALDMSTAFGQDLKSSSIQLGKALNDPIAGLGALSRIGVQFTDEQKDMIEALVKGGDTAKAQGIIMAEVTRQVGGSARATVDPLTQMSNQFSEMKEEVGKALLPAITELVKAITPLVTRVADFIAQHPQLSAGVIIVVGALTGLIAVVGALSLAMGALTAVSMPVLLTIGGIALAVMALVALFIYWKDITNFLGQVFFEVFEAIKAQFMDWWTSITTTVQSIFISIQELVNGIASAFKIAWEAIKNATVVVFEFIKNYMTPWGLAMKIVTVENMKAIADGIMDAWSTIKQFFNDIWNGIKSAFQNAIDYISNLIDKFMEKVQSMMNAVAKVGSTIGGGISSAVSSVASVFKRATGGSVTPNTPYIVGENGQEVFVPNTYGSILNQGQLAGMGGSGITINLNGNTFLGDEGVAEKIGDQLVKILRLNTKL